MTMPLLQPLIPPTEFDLFLDEIGVSAYLNDKQKANLAAKAREIAKYKIMALVMESLTSDEKAEEFDRLLEEWQSSDNPEKVNEFLLREIPHWDALVDEAIRDVKDEIRDGMANLPELITLAQQTAQTGDIKPMRDYEKAQLELAEPMPFETEDDDYENIVPPEEEELPAPQPVAPASFTAPITEQPDATTPSTPAQPSIDPLLRHATLPAPIADDLDIAPSSSSSHNSNNTPGEDLSAYLPENNGAGNQSEDAMDDELESLFGSKP